MMTPENHLYSAILMLNLPSFLCGKTRRVNQGRTGVGHWVNSMSLEGKLR